LRAFRKPPVTTIDETVNGVGLVDGLLVALKKALQSDEFATPPVSATTERIDLAARAAFTDEVFVICTLVDDPAVKLLGFTRRPVIKKLKVAPAFAAAVIGLIVTVTVLGPG
jgi:hypothetical protein